MTTTKDSKALWVDFIAELLQGLLGQVTTVLNVILSDRSKKRVQAVFAVANTASVVDDKKSEALHEEHVSASHKHLVG